MSNYKLGVEVISAHDLMPRDVQGSASPCVELHFDGQKLRTTIKEKDLNPVWNERFYFNISDPGSLPDLGLEACVHNINKAAHSKSFLGKVRIAGTSFVPFADAVVMHYPLEKRGIFSRVKGDLGLKVFLTDVPSVKPSDPLPAIDPFPNNPPPSQIHQMPAQVQRSPFLGGGQIVGGRVIRAEKPPASTYDLVEQMQFLFVRVVKARDLPAMNVSGSLDPYVEVRVGNHRGITKHFEKKQNPEWNEVFFFSRDRMQSSVLEVAVKDNDLVIDDVVGLVRLDLNDVPTRDPPDSPVAPEWYRLEDDQGDKTKGELMLAVWMGTPADEAFPDACMALGCSSAY